MAGTTRTSSTGGPQAGPRRGRSKAVRRTVITLVVLAGLLVAADFGAAAVVEHEVAERAQREFGLRDHPAVKIGGFSFLAQAVSGEYDRVTVDAKGVPVNELRDVEVYAELRGLRAPLSDVIGGTLNGVSVREVEGQVRVKTADVNRAIQANGNQAIASITNLTVEPVSKQTVFEPPAEQDTDAEQERQLADSGGSTAGVKLCGSADVAGQDTQLCVFSIISLADGKIAVTPQRLELANEASNAELPQVIQEKILPLFAITLDPGSLPFAVTPTEVAVETGVLAVKGQATDVVLGGQS